MKVALLSAVLGLCLFSFALARSTPPENLDPIAIAASQTEAQEAPPVQEAPPIEIENWSPPKRGWLYVLDPRPDADGNGGRIWLLDPATGTIMGSIRTGYHPDFALAPNGSYLYIASNTDEHASVIAAVDTLNGTVLGGPTVQDRATDPTLPSYSAMAVSGDGQVLRVLVKRPDSVEFQLDSIDTQSGVLLPHRVGLGHCGDGQFVSFPTVEHVNVVCGTMKKVHMDRTDAASEELDDPYGEFPWNHKYGFATAFPSPDGKYVTIVRGDGAVFEMDAVTLTFYATSAHGGPSDRIYQASWPTSPDGRQGLSRFQPLAGEPRRQHPCGRSPCVRHDQLEEDCHDQNEHSFLERDLFE